MRRHLNADRKRALRALRAAEARLFIAQSGRKRRTGGLDPNDRPYSRDVERRLKRMPPGRLDALLREED